MPNSKRDGIMALVRSTLVLLLLYSISTLFCPILPYFALFLLYFALFYSIFLYFTLYLLLFCSTFPLIYSIAFKMMGFVY